ncbi:hypothetical protein [Rhodanobacter sp. FW106-PBR-LB-2-11]|uniref:hypothetical protein n=1 Tax=Rhodanobacter sp. FW106-PBR-LB-2-11 TaxID=1524463 RepID=UPI0034E384A6
MLDPTLTQALSTPEPRARLAAVVGLHGQLTGELALAIRELVDAAFPAAASASWDSEAHYDDEGGYVTTIDNLAITLLDGTVLYPPTETDEWSLAIDNQFGQFAADPNTTAALEAIKDHEGYMAWLAQRAGIDADLLDQITESVLVYAYSNRSYGTLRWRSSDEPPEPAPPRPQ